MMTIFRLLDGTYESQVRIQDGTESCGIHKTEEEAIEACFQGMEVLNHTKRNKLKRSSINFSIVVDPKQKRTIFRLWNWKSKRYIDQSDFSSLSLEEFHKLKYGSWVDFDDVKAFVAKHYNPDTGKLCHSIDAGCIDIVREETRVEDCLTLTAFVIKYLNNEVKTKKEIEAELAEVQQ
jgi:hypothetical protein